MSATGAMSVRLPTDASLNGHLVDGIFRYITVATSICFVVMTAVLFLAAILHRAGRAQALYTHGTSRRSYLLTIFVAAAIFFGIDVVTLRRSTTHLREQFWNYPEGDPRALRVEVTAQQWAWIFRYPGADGRFATADDILSFNELRVPLDTPIYVKLRSKDVVHSFYLPNFRTKIDAVPGSTTRLWFEARRAGRYEIGCAQHCGVSHYKMRGELVAAPRDEFDRWAARAAADTAARRGAADGADAAAQPVQPIYDGWDWESS